MGQDYHESLLPFHLPLSPSFLFLPRGRDQVWEDSPIFRDSGFLLCTRKPALCYTGETPEGDMQSLSPCQRSPRTVLVGSHWETLPSVLCEDPRG